ncbi:MAG: hypothetical protein HZC36_10765 [Armatimonadetes bacterium]|nr:hypothetical protein [Armatimonadota bacterium]
MALSKIFALLCITLALLPAAKAQDDRIRVAVAGIQSTFEPRFPNADKESVRAEAARVVREKLHQAIREVRYEGFAEDDVRAAIQKLQLDLTKAKDRGQRGLKKLGDELGANFVILATISDASQQNYEASAVLANLSGAASNTKVKVRLWLLDVPGNKLLIDGKVFGGEAKGPRFGTTKREELSGNPADVAASIAQENKRRAEWIGRAAWEAILLALGSVIGIKELYL